MKATLFALFVALLMVGCGEPDLSDPEVLEEATVVVVDWSKLQDRNGITYLPNEETPFTGRAESFYENGQKGREVSYKDGKRDGLATFWYENGQKMEEGSYKDGKEDGLMTNWYENGQKKKEANYEKGKIMSLVVWKPNGEKCPLTYIDEDGNGNRVWYNDDGTVSFRTTYKDGEQSLN